jgi:hypothetical protein
MDPGARTTIEFADVRTRSFHLLVSIASFVVVEMKTLLDEMSKRVAGSTLGTRTRR